MEDTQRLRFFVTYRPSFVWTAILAFLHLTMIASTFLEVRGKTYIYPDIRTSEFQTLRTVLFTLYCYFRWNIFLWTLEQELWNCHLLLFDTFMP